MKDFLFSVERSNNIWNYLNAIVFHKIWFTHKTNLGQTTRESFLRAKNVLATFFASNLSKNTSQLKSQYQLYLNQVRFQPTKWNRFVGLAN